MSDQQEKLDMQNNQLSAKLQNKGAAPTAGGLKDAAQKWFGQNERKITALMGSRKEAFRLFDLAMVCVSKNPKLIECGESLFRAVMRCADFGLYPEPLHEVALVPVWSSKLKRNVCEVWLQYQGWTKLLYNSGHVRNVTSEVVWEGDDFNWELGTNEHIFHRPAMIADRGEKRIGVYSIIDLITGGKKHMFLSAEQVEAYRLMGQASDSPYVPWNSKNPWVADWMWKAKAVKQGAKLAPKSIHLAKAIDYDDGQEIGKEDEMPLIDLTSGMQEEDA